MVNSKRDDGLAEMGDRVLATAPGRFVLAGFSMGGVAALLADAEAHHPIAALRLVDTHADSDVAERADEVAALIDPLALQPQEAHA